MLVSSPLALLSKKGEKLPTTLLLPLPLLAPHPPRRRRPPAPGVVVEKPQRRHVRDVEPVGEDDQAQALFLDVSGDLVDLARVVLLLGVDDQEGA